ncbi:hypothetical protein MSPP1_001106 [Malassezia sp. CBS 17886]|nr:hypothetical protein MSPP1_001106 [Malassezia sp. CBS 17886]
MKFSPPPDEGSGRSLPSELLLLCTCATIFTTVFSSYSVLQQLKHYYKPYLQRYVVRILIMPLLYAVTSTVSLFSLQLAEMIGLVRDLYEVRPRNHASSPSQAFVIYCFFNLLVEYLGGESEICAMLQGRPPTPQIFPFNLFFHSMDLSDPYTFLSVKRGIQQYVQLKPILAVATVLLKIAGHYQDGRLNVQNGYTWIALLYNISVFIAIYSLTMFWVCLHKELEPFRVPAKFLCVKGVVFFSFWQGLTISILVAAGIIRHIGSVVDDIYLSAALQDTLISLEMPIFAVASAHAFSHSDYVQPPSSMAGRLPFLDALQDSFGIGDVLADLAVTFRGTEYTYRSWEESDNVVHHSHAFQHRSRAGLRYMDGGKKKYWLEQGPNDPVAGGDRNSPGYEHARLQSHATPSRSYGSTESTSPAKEQDTVHFGSPSDNEQDLYSLSRKLPYGDYRYPCIDDLDIGDE